MKVILRTLCITGIALLCNKANASTLDINAPGPYDPPGLFAGYSNTISIAQTFTPNFTMRLDALQIWYDTFFAPPLTPYTLSFYEAPSPDTPIGTLLGSTIVNPGITPIYGVTVTAATIALSDLNMVLQRGKKYSFVFSTEDQNATDMVGMYSGWSTSTHAPTVDSYPQGMLWMNSDGTWKPMASWLSEFNPGTSDIAFRTYGTPAIPEPTTLSLLALGVAIGVVRQRFNREAPHLSNA